MQSKYFDNSTHANLIKKVQFTNRVDLVLCLEQNSNKIKYYTAECQEFEHQKKKLQFQIPYEEGQPSFVVDFNVAESLGIVRPAFALPCACRGSACPCKQIAIYAAHCVDRRLGVWVFYKTGLLPLLNLAASRGLCSLSRRLLGSSAFLF